MAAQPLRRLPWPQSVLGGPVLAMDRNQGQAEGRSEPGDQPFPPRHLSRRRLRNQRVAAQIRSGPQDFLHPAAVNAAGRDEGKPNLEEMSGDLTRRDLDRTWSTIPAEVQT